MFTNYISKILIVLLVFAAVLVIASFATHSAAMPAADRSYESVEQARTLRPLAHAVDMSGYEQIETVLVQRSTFPAISAYDSIEQLRIKRGLGADRSCDQIESVRLL